MSRVVEFYKGLPRGAAEVKKPSGLWGRYKAAYFDGEKASAARMSTLTAGSTSSLLASIIRGLKFELLIRSINSIVACNLGSYGCKFFISYTGCKQMNANIYRP